MKELSNEQKAQRYDEAIKRLEDIKTGKCKKAFVFSEGLFDYLFPELAESEDERIRKALINMFKGYNIQKVGDFTDKEIIAWLEKLVPVNEEKVLIGARKDVALSIINYLDNK